MTQPPEPKPKTIYEMTAAELRAALAAGGGVVRPVHQFSPVDYANELARREAEESINRANAIAARTACLTNGLIWATIFSGVAAAASAIAAAWLTISQSHHETPQPPPVTVTITQTAPPPAPVTITQTVAPPPVEQPPVPPR